MSSRETETSNRRREILRAHGLLESPPEDEWQRIATLATRLLAVPVSVLSWLPESTPDGVVAHGTGELSASIPDELQRQTVTRNEPVVTSAESSPTPDDSEYTDSYALAPLRLNEIPVGIIGVRDHRGRHFGEEDRDNLELLAQQASDLLNRSPDRSSQEDDNPGRTYDVRSSSEAWRDLIEDAPLAFYLLDGEGEFLRVNDRACEQLGYERGELLERSLMDVDYSFTTTIEFREFVNDMDPGDVREFESLHTAKDRRQFPVLVRVRKTHSEQPGHLMAWVQDITEVRELQHELRRTRDRLWTVIDTAPVGIVGIDPSDRVRVWNPAAEELFGWSEEEILGETLHTVPENRREEHKQLKDKAVQGESVRNMETKRLTKDGEEVDVLLSTSVVQELGDDNLVSLGYFQDISKLKETQENLERALEEKANLLREVHHRVKNNLQVIKSMLNLHERKTGDRPGDVLDDCRDRIQTMAMIHDKLYQSEKFAELPFADYVEELVDHVLSCYDYQSSTDVHVNVDSTLNLPLSYAFPCGLIVHELVSNACVHGFQPNSNNRLEVEMQRNDDRVHLRVRDNGRGFPDTFDPTDVESLGFEILRSLGEYELDGTLTVSTDPLTTVELSFELSHPETGVEPSETD